MKHHIALAALPLFAAFANPSAAGNDQPLTTWRFVAIDGKAPIYAKSELRILDSRLTAYVGCNRMAAELKVEPGQLKVSPVMSTKMFCANVMEQERTVAELLAASPHFFIEGDRFVMRSGSHSAELVKAIGR